MEMHYTVIPLGTSKVYSALESWVIGLDEELGLWVATVRRPFILCVY